MEVDILSLFPGYFVGPFSESMIKRGVERGIILIRQTNIRDFATNKHHRVDAAPFGGGPGMVMMAEPVVAALRSVKRADSHVIYLSPRGQPLTHQKCKELSQKKHLILLCGHYEGVDERVSDEVCEEISIGDYVLTNGALAAIVLVDAVSRFLPGFLGDESSAAEDSFAEGLLEAPQYVYPRNFEGKEVPAVLLSGNHAAIHKWRREKAEEKTQKVRPDLFERYQKKNKF